MMTTIEEEQNPKASTEFKTVAQAAAQIVAAMEWAQTLQQHLPWNQSPTHVIKSGDLVVCISCHGLVDVVVVVVVFINVVVFNRKKDPRYFLLSRSIL